MPVAELEFVRPQIHNPSRMQQPEDKVWNAITESAKTRFDFNEFDQAFSEFDLPNASDNVLFMIIAGYAARHSPEKIASDIRMQFAAISIGFREGALERLMKDKETQLKTEIRATAIAMAHFERGAKVPGVLVSVRSILASS